MHRPLGLVLTALFLGCSAAALSAADPASEANTQPTEDLFARENLVAWCIVPFDEKKRGPQARAEMLNRLGISKLAYDYRAEHIPTFDDELRALKEHDIELTAWWFPTTLNDEARHILDVLKRNDVQTQLWVTGGGAPGSEEEIEAWIDSEVARIRPIAEAAAEIGCSVGLYNHGGWFGEPENQITIIKRLDLPNVGIVYNLHHGHAHVEHFSALMHQILPYLIAVNLNGMTPEGDQHGDKILPLGAGELDLGLLRIIRDSGYTGPIGILNHTDRDAEARLQDNLDGLEWLSSQLSGNPPGEKPKYRSWQPSPPSDASTSSVHAGSAAYRTPPITVECQATLWRKDTYNILVASDTKQSPAHWEVFSMRGNGFLTAYLPGYQPDHVRSTVNICDNRPHHIAMVFEPSRVQLFLDGRRVADQTVTSSGQAAVPGGLAIGRLVEGRLSCHGNIDWVRISRGVRPPSAETSTSPPEKDDATLGLWILKAQHHHPADVPSPSETQSSAVAPPYSKQLVAETAQAVRQSGNAGQGVGVFAAAKFACLSCHKVGSHGGSVGPELTAIGKERTIEQIIESIYWPKREVKPEFDSLTIVTADGNLLQGYQVSSDEHELVLLDPASGEKRIIPHDEIDDSVSGGTLMPDGLAAAMSPQQQIDLICFLSSLGREESLPLESIESVFAHAHSHAPEEFPYDRAPLLPEHWPNWQHTVNRDRIYDFYTKQAEYFRNLDHVAPLLPEFPGLDGGTLGHWGNQDEETWADDRWNETELGSVQCGIFHGAGLTIPRAVCVRLGEEGELSACFNPDTLRYEAVWSGGFVKFSSVRHGFLSGITMVGEPIDLPKKEAPGEPFEYHGFYRYGPRVVFAYRIGETEYLDAAWTEDGEFVRTVAPADLHPLKYLTQGGPAQWPQEIETRVERGSGSPYAVDTFELPVDNPWKALVFCGGHDFFPDGNGLVCTMQGDVWHVDDLTATSREAAADTVTWRRFASGLHHALGMVVDPDGIFVQCRDQLMRLHDLNSDGEADFYECFSNAFETSAAGHDFICGLEREPQGRFYTVTGNQGLIRISPDGKRSEVLAEGFRNADGLGLLPDGTITVPCSEGGWTPASMICAVRDATAENSTNVASPTDSKAVPFFGYGGPRDGNPPELPLVYVPRGLDNSSGGQTYVASERWGPLTDQLIHFSFGTGAHFLVLRDEVDGQLQGAIVPLPGEFRSGAHRGRFNPVDGQLYVSGMAGWGSYTPDDGCFQRVRYTGEQAQLPVAFHAYENGISVTFAEAIDPAVAELPESHFAQVWNYRYSSAYGSPEFSTHHFGARGHDPLSIRRAHVSSDHRTLFIELPELQPVNQLHLRLRTNAGDAHDLFITVHKLDGPYTEMDGYEPREKEIAAHPILADLALATIQVPNPWQKPIEGAREIILETGKNLTFAERTIRVKAGEPLQFTLSNPDVVPHNWALVQPGTLRRVGEMSNRLVADPEAAARHYIPHTSDVLYYTDVVPPRDEFTIYVRAPEEPGRYPYLCTFPGHWMVMNGELIVE